MVTYRVVKGGGVLRCVVVLALLLCASCLSQETMIVPEPDGAQSVFQISTSPGAAPQVLAFAVPLPDGPLALPTNTTLTLVFFSEPLAKLGFTEGLLKIGPGRRIPDALAIYAARVSAPLVLRTREWTARRADRGRM